MITDVKLDSASIQPKHFFFNNPFSTVIVVGGEPYVTHPVGVASIIADMKIRLRLYSILFYFLLKPPFSTVLLL